MFSGLNNNLQAKWNSIKVVSVWAAHLSVNEEERRTDSIWQQVNRAQCLWALVLGAKGDN